MSASDRSPRSAAVGRATRVGLSAQVLAMVLVAGASAFLATWLAARRGLHLRFDLSENQRNTLDPALIETIESLPANARVDTFLRPLDPPLDAISLEAIGRVRDFLFLVRSSVGDKLDVVHHDLGDVSGAAQRLSELDLREDNVIVVSLGERRAVLRLFRDVVVLDQGSVTAPQRPPSIQGLRAEEALARALRRVSIGEPPRVLFSTGHGEREIYEPGATNWSSLRAALLADGFDVAWWDVEKEPEVPSGCAVLAIVDPAQPLSDETSSAIERWVRAGGRLLGAPSTRYSTLTGKGSVAELLSRLGVETAVGVVANPFRAPNGELVVGDPRCAGLAISAEGLDARHEITESLWRARRSLAWPGSRAFVRGSAVENAVAIDLVRAPRASWIDRPSASGLHDWRPDPRTEEQGAVTVCMSTAFAAEAAATSDAGEREPQARAVALGSPDAFSDQYLAYNRDFALNVFNWLAARDWRLSIAPRSRIERKLDVRSTDALVSANRIAVIALPGLCALLGALLYWRRRR